MFQSLSESYFRCVCLSKLHQLQDAWWTYLWGISTTCQKCSSPVARMKCWQITFLQTTAAFKFVCVICYVLYISSKCVIYSHYMFITWVSCQEVEGTVEELPSMSWLQSECTLQHFLRCDTTEYFKADFWDSRVCGKKKEKRKRKERYFWSEVRPSAAMFLATQLFFFFFKLRVLTVHRGRSLHLLCLSHHIGAPKPKPLTGWIPISIRQFDKLAGGHISHLAACLQVMSEQESHAG